MTIAKKSTRLCATALMGASLVGCGGGGDAQVGGNGSGSGAPVAADANSVRIASVLAAGPALNPAPVGLSGNVICDNMSIGAFVLDSVIVPANAACQLDGTTLRGTLSVAQGGVLDAAGIQVTGNIQADSGAHVLLERQSSVGGSVQIKQGGTALVVDSVITGDLQFDTMAGRVAAAGNRIGGNLQIFGNLGGIAVERNLITGNLQCWGNSSLPVSVDNSAALVEGQCVSPSGGSGGGGGAGGTVPAGVVAGNVTCTGLRIGAVQVDSISVPENATCVLEATRLTGSITVGLNGTLIATDVNVTGNLIANGSAGTLLGGSSRIGGSVQIKQGESASVTGASITGDLQIESMRGPVTASTNAIGGNLQATGNSGAVSISANRIAGALQCTGNTLPPLGGGNIATIKENQCLNL